MTDRLRIAHLRIAPQWAILRWAILTFTVSDVLSAPKVLLAYPPAQRFPSHPHPLITPSCEVRLKLYLLHTIFFCLSLPAFKIALFFGGPGKEGDLELLLH